MSDNWIQRSYACVRPPLRLWGPANGFELWSDIYQLCGLNPNCSLKDCSVKSAEDSWILVNNGGLSASSEGHPNLAALQDVIALLEQSNTFSRSDMSVGSNLHPEFSLHT